MICILVRDFATTQEKSLTPNLPDIPLILIEAGVYRPKVIAADAEARQAGVTAGMWLGEARSLCPQALFLAVDEQRYQRLFMDITCDLLHITDRIEPEYQATSAAWYSDDTLMLPHLLKAIQTATGIAPQVGIAPSKFPARVASAINHSDQVLQIAKGQEHDFLSAYPVSLLPLDKSMRRRLPLLGIKTLGQLTAIPRIAIWEQFGKHGRWLHDLANGKDIRPLAPFKAPLILSQKSNFDEPLSERAILHRHLEKLSLMLSKQLAGCEAQAVTLITHLDNAQILDYHRQPHKSIDNHLYLLRLITQMLDGLSIDSAVSELEVRLSDIQQKVPTQLALFESHKPIVSLQAIASEWAGRHRQAEFYRLERTAHAFLMEERIESQRVSGA